MTEALGTGKFANGGGATFGGNRCNPGSELFDRSLGIFGGNCGFPASDSLAIFGADRVALAEKFFDDFDDSNVG